MARPYIMNDAYAPRRSIYRRLRLVPLNLAQRHKDIQVPYNRLVTNIAFGLLGFTAQVHHKLLSAPLARARRTVSS